MLSPVVYIFAEMRLFFLKGMVARDLMEGAEKGINFYALENRLFEEVFKFLQVCPNFRFSRGYYQKNGAYRPYFPFLLSSIRFILTRFDANIATALCIVNALRP